MEKLTISQIMKLADGMKNFNWIITLIDLNNRGQIEPFFKEINQTNLLHEALINTDKIHTR